MKGQAIDSMGQLSDKRGSSDPFNGVSQGDMVRDELQMVVNENIGI